MPEPNVRHRKTLPFGRRRQGMLRLGGWESLESRWALDGEGVIWGDSPYLSVSFAPDGTDVGGKASQLYSSLNQIAPAAQWQQAILTALQTWVVHVNGDVAMVADHGQPFGSAGLSQGDPRFGDVRVAAIPMRNNVYAVGISRGFVAGTWAGDMVFNSNRILHQHPGDVDQLDEIFRIALHEGGHVFGLDDNGNPDSPMHSHGIPSVVIPHPNDISDLQSRFGERAPDMHEIFDNNNSQAEATHIESSSEFAGSFPLILFGDVGAADIDVYRLSSIDLYTGAITLHLRTRDLSLLQPKLTIRDRLGNTLAEAASSSANDDMLTLTLPAVDPAEKYYAYVEGATSGVHAIGGYALIVTFDSLLQSSPAALERFSGPEFRFLEQDDIQEFFAGNDEGDINDINDDMHTDDSLAFPADLDSQPGYVQNSRYFVEASLASGTDIDVYRVRSPDFVPLMPRVMTVVFKSTNGGSLDPTIEILDQAGDLLSAVPLIRHSGESILQLAEIPSNTQYFLRLSDPSAIGSGQSNYQMTVIFGAAAQTLNTVATAELTSNVREHLVAFTNASLVTPAIWGSANNSPSASWLVSILDANNHVVSSFSGAANSYRSAPSVYLSPGNYRIRVASIGEPPTPQSPWGYQLRMAVVTDPLSVPLIRATRRMIRRVDRVGEDFVMPNDPSRHTAPSFHARQSRESIANIRIDTALAQWDNTIL